MSSQTNRIKVFTANEAAQQAQEAYENGYKIGYYEGRRNGLQAAVGLADYLRAFAEPEERVARQLERFSAWLRDMLAEQDDDGFADWELEERLRQTVYKP